jgi:hypothetical protein
LLNEKLNNTEISIEIEQCEKLQYSTVISNNFSDKNRRLCTFDFSKVVKHNYAYCSIKVENKYALIRGVQ